MSYQKAITTSENNGFTALADPTRRRIIALLAVRDRTVKEIAEHFSVSRPAISKHLRVLRKAGLVTERKRGRERVHLRGLSRAREAALTRLLLAWAPSLG